MTVTFAAVTYSIVAFDAATGELGAAVQSHWFSTGRVVPWVRPGVGAVCTQSFAEPSYGPDLLDRLAAGAEPRAALQELLAADAGAALRQVAVVDAGGATAAHTGALCVSFAGHERGSGFSVQANIMRTAAVWPAMASAFVAAPAGLPLARRLLAALDAAEAAGGDLRGRQSAALIVAPPSGEPWRTSVDLRVDDHPEPLDELRRLLDLHEAYELAGAAEARVAAGQPTDAATSSDAALTLAPASEELRFWAGLGAAQAGDVELALERVRSAIAANPDLAELLRRLPAEIAPSAAAVLRALDEP